MSKPKLPSLQPEDSTIVTARGFYHRYSRRILPSLQPEELRCGGSLTSFDDVANLLEELGLDDLDRVDEGFGVDGEYESDEDVVITGYEDGGGKRRKVY